MFPQKNIQTLEKRSEQARMPHLPTEDPQRGARQYRTDTASAERSVANERNKADGPRSSFA
jgi:hypothetical protein